MRNDDPADPTAWKDLRQRICETNSDVNVAHEQVRQKASLIDKAKHRASRFRNERADKEHSADVRRVAARLQNRVVIIIGGERKPHGCDALKSAFRLNDLIWISTREHGSPGQLEDYVARQDVAAVLLAICWTSHSYGAVKDFCRKHGKVFVRLPSGYNPNQVAHQLLCKRTASETHCRLAEDEKPSKKRQTKKTLKPSTRKEN